MSDTPPQELVPCLLCGIRHRYQFPNGSGPSGHKHSYTACVNSLLGRAEAAEAELAELRATNLDLQVEAREAHQCAEAAEARVRAALELHQPRLFRRLTVCSHCSTLDDHNDVIGFLLYPCPTVRALGADESSDGAS